MSTSSSASPSSTGANGGKLRSMTDTGKTLLLTGASRGIGHATVKRFSAAGWRVIAVSRHPFPEDCPWEGGAENHVQLDLADLEGLPSAIEALRKRLKTGRLDALVNNAGISPKREGG